MLLEWWFRVLRLVGIEPPDAIRLIRLKKFTNLWTKGIEDGVRLRPREKDSLPLSPFFLFFCTKPTLLIFDFGFFCRRGLFIMSVNGLWTR